MNKTLANFLRFLLFLGIGLGILYLVYRSQNAAFQEDCALKGIPAESCSLMDKVFSDFRGANYFWIALVLISFTISNVSRAIRWILMLRSLGYRPRLINGFLSVALGYFANLGLPRMGEVVRAGTMAQYERIGVEKVMGTIILDRILDVISLLSITALAVVLEFDTMAKFVEQYVDLGERFGDGRIFLFGGLLLAFGLLLFFLLRRRLSQTALFTRLAGLAKGFKEGLLSIRQVRQPFWFVFHSINIWVMYFFMTYLCFFAFVPTAHLGPLVGLVAFVFGGWGVVVPSPGGMGTYHFLVQTALQMYGINGDDAFSWANIAFFSIQLGCNLLLGVIALLILPIINRGYHPEAVASVAA